MLQVALLDIRSCANVGNILRTAKAFEFSQIHLIGTTPSHNRKEVQKVALGGEINKFYYYKTWSEFIVKNSNSNIIAIETGGQKLYSYKPKKENIILVLGTERAGLSEAELKDCTTVLSVNHAMKKIKSLNVASAFAIASSYFYNHLSD